VNTATRERNIQIVAAVAHFLAHFLMLVFPSFALVLRHDWGLSLGECLQLGFGMYLLYGLGALPAGLLTDAFRRPRLMLVVCLAGLAGGVLWASAARTPRELSWALALTGLFASIYHPAGMAWISLGVRRRGQALGLNGVFGNLGVVAAPLAAGLLASLVGWRTAYALLAIPAGLAALLALRLQASGTEEPDRPETKDGTGGRRTALAFSVLCVAMMLGGIAYRGQTVVLPAWFQERMAGLWAAVADWTWIPGDDRGLIAATGLTSLAYLAGAVGQMIGGRLADRYDLRRVYAAFHLCSLPLLVLLGSLADAPLLLCALGYAFFAFGMQPAENSLVAALTPPRLRSTGYGLKFVLVFGVGSLAVKLVGRWTSAGDLGGVFPRLALFTAGLLILVALLALITRGRTFANRS
jgi:MFS family permease